MNTLDMVYLYFKGESHCKISFFFIFSLISFKFYIACFKTGFLWIFGNDILSTNYPNMIELCYSAT